MRRGACCSRRGDAPLRVWGSPRPLSLALTPRICLPRCFQSPHSRGEMGTGMEAMLPRLPAGMGLGNVGAQRLF